MDVHKFDILAIADFVSIAIPLYLLACAPLHYFPILDKQSSYVADWE